MKPENQSSTPTGRHMEKTVSVLTRPGPKADIFCLTPRCKMMHMAPKLGVPQDSAKAVKWYRMSA
jgi:hypothetical protein